MVYGHPYLNDPPHLLPSIPSPAFTLFQLVAVGSASFFAAALLSALAYSYCHHLNRPSAESAVIHPSTPNHLTYNKQGNSMPKNEKYIPMEFKVGWFNKKSTVTFFRRIKIWNVRFLHQTYLHFHQQLCFFNGMFTTIKANSFKEFLMLCLIWCVSIQIYLCKSD